MLAKSVSKPAAPQLSASKKRRRSSLVEPSKPLSPHEEISVRHTKRKRSQTSDSQVVSEGAQNKSKASNPTADIVACDADLKEPSLEELCANVAAASHAILAPRPTAAANKLEILLRSERVHFLLTMKHVPHINRILRFKLPHSLHASTDTTCLIVKDTEGRDYEKTGKHWRELLAREGVSLEGVQVLPLRELTVSYMSFEAKRQLVYSHEWFITDQRIAHRLPNKLGRTAYGQLRARIPIPVDLESRDLKGELHNAEHTMRVHVDGRGARVASVIGHRGMSVSQLEEQLRAVMQQISSRLPGGVDNLRAVSLCADGMPEVPLFVSLLPLLGKPPADSVDPVDTWEEDLAVFREELGWTVEDMALEEERDLLRLKRNKKKNAKSSTKDKEEKSADKKKKSRRQRSKKAATAAAATLHLEKELH